MKKQIFLLVAATGAASAYAERRGVSAYGTADAGLFFQSRVAGANPVENLGRKHSLNSGGIAPSVLGFRGSEDLGRGYSAGFNLENHIDISSGSGNDLGPLWARAANVSFAGPFGKLTIGQQMTPAVIAYAATDPRGLRESLSGLGPWARSSAQNFGVNGANTNVIFANFAANAVSYAVDAAGIHAAALYSFGEKPGAFAYNRAISVGVSYSGPVLVSASYHTTNWTSGDNKSDRKMTVGAGYAIGQFTVKGNVLNSKTYAATGAQLSDYRIHGLGLETATGESNSMTLAYYHGKNATGPGDNKANSWVVGDEYALSKRTVLYAQAARIDAGTNADAAVSILGAQPVQGRTTVVSNIGLRHSF